MLKISTRFVSQHKSTAHLNYKTVLKSHLLRVVNEWLKERLSVTLNVIMLDMETHLLTDPSLQADFSCKLF